MQLAADRRNGRHRIQKSADAIRNSYAENPSTRNFWTYGQGTIGWRDVLVPALKSGTDVLFWPFDGHLDDLLQIGNIVIAETYPAEYYRRFFPEPLKSKSKQELRREVSAALLNWASRMQVTIETALRREIENGFASGDMPHEIFLTDTLRDFPTICRA